MINMNKIEANWVCNNCQQSNWVSYIPEELNSKIYACCNCGKVHCGFKISDKKRRGWLECIAFKGLGSTLPAGHTVNGETGEVHWNDPNNGSILTKEEFALKYGWDPWTIWCRLPRNRDDPICKGYDDRCNKKASFKTEDLLDELLKEEGPSIKRY
jgi:hypothetical protein